MRPVRSPRSYATALHEIGHILGRHQRSQAVLVRERWAWHWAKRNALQWTPEMRRHAAWCITDLTLVVRRPPALTGEGGAS